jgi:hypothetical protein
MTLSPSADFLKYLNSIVGEPANIITTAPLHYDNSTGNLYIDQASATSGGYISTSAQVIAGQKTFLVPPIGVTASASSVQSTTSETTIYTTFNGNSFFDFYGKSDGVVSNEIKIYGKGNNSSIDSEFLAIGYNPLNYEIKSDVTGSGTFRNLNINAPKLSIISTENSGSISTGSMVLNGGMGVTKTIYIGGDINCLGTINGTVSGGADYSVLPFSYAVGGAVHSPPAFLTGFIVKINNLIALNFSYLSSSAAVSTTIYTAAGALPAQYRPSIATYGYVSVINGGNNKQGTCKIYNDGTIELYVGASDNFGSSGNNGINPCGLTYYLS